MLVFEEIGNQSTRRKPLAAEKRTNKLNPHMTPDVEIEPWPHRQEASALTTAPSLHPQISAKPIGWLLKFCSVYILSDFLDLKVQLNRRIRQVKPQFLASKKWVNLYTCRLIHQKIIITILPWLVLLLIGWKTGKRLLSQSLHVTFAIK